MSTEKDNNGQGAPWPMLLGMLFGIVLLIAALAMGIGLCGCSCLAAAAPAAGAASGAAPMSAPSTMDSASVWVEDGVVKFYFASGSAELAAGAKEALTAVVLGVATGKKAVISGYHDVTGDPARNEELARQRALAVRDTLMALGIGEDKIELKKPEVLTGTGSNAEARRVEVRLE